MAKWAWPGDDVAGPGQDERHVIQQPPVIGPVLAVMIIAEVGDVTRIKNACQLASWAGSPAPVPRPQHGSSHSLVWLPFRAARER